MARPTPAAMLELLTRLLPPGRTSEARKASDNSTFVQIYLDRGQGPGMIRLLMTWGHGTGGPCEPSMTCYPVPGGGTLTVTGITGNCIQEDLVEYSRPDGVFIMLNLASCLMWDGTANRPGPKALTTQEAVDLVMDPRWGQTMPKEIVDSGAARFPNLRDFG
jgi:hypothetical protein